MANSPADRQVAANDQREALACALYGVEKELREEYRSHLPGRLILPTWELLPEDQRGQYRELARRLLVRELVKPGKGLPDLPPKQIEGQQELNLP